MGNRHDDIVDNVYSVILVYGTTNTLITSSSNIYTRVTGKAGAVTIIGKTSIHSLHFYTTFYF